MPKYPWRIQGDIALGETDPLITVFMGEEETDEDTGAQSIRQDTNNPVVMRLSQFGRLDDLVNTDLLRDKRDQQRAERLAAKAAAELAGR